jgi:serine/threonine protein kinase
MDMTHKKLISSSDRDFLLNMNLFASIPGESVTPLLNSLDFKHVKAGERFITQGDEGDSFYIIHKGSCIINIEKDNILNAVARLKAGDIVGEMAVLTGERRSSHADAETDMELWSLTREQFDKLSRDFPDIRNFLTDIIVQRFSSLKITADRTIGKYTINEILDKGGWSIVYKGVHSILNFPVAIKMLKHNMAMDPDFLEKFQHEAKTIARLNHPNIVKVYDIEDRYRTLFIIMEFLEGFSLKYLLSNMPKLSLSGTLDIILQLCSGLQYAHKQGIIHQDVKPANIFIQPNGQAKLVDFGLACPPGNIDFDMPGTPFYMSPEQIQGEPVDERADIYSLGIVVYEMLTGKRPFPEDNLGKLLDFHVKEDAPDPRLLIPDIPEELCSVVMKSVRRDPAERFNNVSEIIDKLRPLANKTGLNCQSLVEKKQKMMGIFLFYKDEHQLDLNRLLDKLNNDVSEIGVLLRVVNVEDI